ncbi:O-antigen ligase family protein [Clostridium tarantellae]|uniref:O-antigen ligase-related domain-containing protein n=1 Tax=Clostridium tarantellae TaxID=39493 RepID=A0A6I1ML26_9CLOT|nr:O-antigen ligase family protein [Clostridium tarantellae]MPQ44206.1 hypothetical protein [Clostridium tarantellae]
MIKSIDKNINLIIAGCLIIFSTFYLGNVLPISPIYLFYGIAIILLIYSFIKRINNIGDILKDKLYIFNIIYCLYLGIDQILVKANLTSAMYVIMSLTYFSLVLFSIKPLSNYCVMKISKIFINFSVVLFTIETIIRYLNPEKKYFTIADGSLKIYAYKFNSIMLSDSNAVSILYLVLLFFSIYLFVKHKQNQIIQIIILNILVVMTISRAAIISMIIFEVLIILMYLLKNKFKLSSKYIYGALVIVGIVGLTLLFYKFRNDGSFMTKLTIFNDGVDYIENASVKHLLFGVGFENSINYLLSGFPAHNFILSFFVESGIIGLLILIIFYIMIIKANPSTVIVIFPFLLAAMSYAGYGLPFLYAVLAIIVRLKGLENNE